MKTYILFISSSPFSTLKVHQALDFAKNLISNGNLINQIFFYSDAVLVANSSLEADNSKFNLHIEWKKFASEHQIALNVCVTASLARGIVGIEESLLTNIPVNLTLPFAQTGMGAIYDELRQNPSINLVQF